MLAVQPTLKKDLSVTQKDLYLLQSLFFRPNYYGTVFADRYKGLEFERYLKSRCSKNFYPNPCCQMNNFQF